MKRFRNLLANKLLKKFNQKQLKLMLTSHIELVNNEKLK